MAQAPIESPPQATPRIFEIRGLRVMLDSDLAALYGVSTKRLNEQVRRNADRFPSDFLLELSNQEVAASRSHIATLNKGRGHNLKYRPMAFTEHGAIMVATVLNSARAAQMTIYVVRAFVKMRESLIVHSQLARELATLKGRVDTLDADTRKQFDLVYEAILGMMSPTTKRQ